MHFEIRELHGAKDIKGVIDLQEKIGGLPPRDTMSPITLAALTMQHPRIGWVLGGFDGDTMAGFFVGMAAASPGLAFGHMMGVLNEYRDTGLGAQLLHVAAKWFARSGMRRICWTYEPLESRNAHLYINKLGARCVTYLKDHYLLDSGIHHGMPQDRLLLEVDLPVNMGARHKPVLLGQVIDRYPIAQPGALPSGDEILLEIPGDLRRLQARDATTALRWRMESRGLFEECINQRKMTADRFYTGLDGEQRRSFYLFRRSPRL